MKRSAPLVAVLILGLAGLCRAGAPAPEDGSAVPNQPEEILAEAEIYFESAQYALAHRMYAAYRPAGGTELTPAEIHYYQGRCLLGMGEAASDIETKRRHLRAGLQALRQAVDAEALPAGLRPEALTWLGRTRLALARLQEQDEAGRLLAAAAQSLTRAVSLADHGSTDYEARFHLALAAAERAQRASTAQAAAARYGEAIDTLDRLLLNYPQHLERPRAELLLIWYQFRAGRYGEAVATAERFHRTFPDAALTPVVHYLQAEALYYSGRLEEAVQQYDAAIATAGGETAEIRQARRWLDGSSSSLALDATYGKAWCYARLASTAGRQRRLRYLRQASTAFRTTLQQLPETNERYAPAQYKHAETLVALGDYEAARRELRPLLHSPTYRLQASFLSGRAALLTARQDGTGTSYAIAYRHFQRTRHLADKSGQTGPLLDALHHLALIELQRHRPARALLHAEAAETAAGKVRAFVALAQARLLKARALLALALPQGEEEAQPADAAPATVAYEAQRLLAAAVLAPRALPEQARVLTLTLDSTRLHGLPPRRLLGLASEILELLLHRHAERLRLDEVLYYRGLVRRAQADLAAADLIAPAGGAPARSAVQSVGEAYDACLEALETCLKTNPRGNFSAQTYRQLGEARYRAGEFYREAAARFARRDDKESARLFRDHARRHLKQAPEDLQNAVETAPDAGLRHRALLTLGRTHELRDNPADAERVYRQLLARPELGPDLRARATRRLAATLIGTERREEAVLFLQKFLQRSRRAETRGRTSPTELALTHLLLGRTAAALERAATARQAYAAAADLPLGEAPAGRELKARALTRLHALELAGLPDAAARDPLPDAAREALAGLQAVAQRYADLPWAQEALLESGRFFLQRDAPGRALELVEAWKEKLPGPNRLALDLLAAQALIEQGKVEAGTARFEEVARRSQLPPARPTLGAEALLEKARAHLAHSRRQSEAQAREQAFEAATRTYARVYARYPGLEDLADQARYEAARALLDRSEEVTDQRRELYRRRARATLEGITDLGLAATLQRRLEGYARSQPPATAGAEE